jgi:hypothetical protein
LAAQLPCSTSWSIWLTRTFTSANSAATKNPLMNTNPAMTRTSVNPMRSGFQAGVEGDGGLGSATAPGSLLRDSGARDSNRTAAPSHPETHREALSIAQKKSWARSRNMSLVVWRRPGAN